MKFEKLKNSQNSDVKIELTFEEARLIRRALATANFDEILQNKNTLEVELFKMFCNIDIV